MTLDETIKHYEEVAESCERGNPKKRSKMECAKKNRQLADWLKALKEIWDSGDCNDCGNRGCLYKPKLGHLVRYNCPFYRKEVNADEDSN